MTPMSLRSIVTTLAALSTVFASPSLPSPLHVHKRALNVYEQCSQPNDIALTFDDGPYIYLREISDAFTQAGSKATFFFNGNNYDCIYNSARIADIKYAFNAGHMIGSHTWSHASLPSLSTPQIQDAMYRMEEAFSRILGVKPGFMRPPFGDTNSNVQSISFARNQNVALWDWDTGDADGNTTSQSEAVYNQIANQHPSNALVLEHEPLESTAHTLVPYAINLFKSKGYNLVTMAQCLGVQPYAAIGVPQQQSSSWTCNGSPDPGEACGGSIACSTGTPTLSTTSSGPQPTETNRVIHPNGNTGKCLGAASNADGAAVTIQDCNGATAQSWTRSGSILQLFGNKCLDVTGGTQTSGTKMQIWTCGSGNANQQWSISGSTIQWSGTSFCLDNTGGSVTNGNQAQIWSCTGGPNQQWQIVAGGGGGPSSSSSLPPSSSSRPPSSSVGPSSSSSAPPPPPTGVAIHPSASSSTCVTVQNNANNAPVVVQPCDGSASQSWTRSGSTFVIYNNKCLDVASGNTTNGVHMQVYTCSAGNSNQAFTYTSGKTITWNGHPECLDLSGGRLTAGNYIQMWACRDANANQVWNIT